MLIYNFRTAAISAPFVNVKLSFGAYHTSAFGVRILRRKITQRYFLIFGGAPSLGKIFCLRTNRKAVIHIPVGTFAVCGGDHALRTGKIPLGSRVCAAESVSVKLDINAQIKPPNEHKRLRSCSCKRCKDRSFCNRTSMRPHRDSFRE